MPLTLAIADILPRFPLARIACVVVEGATNAATRPAGLEAEIARREARCRNRFAGTDLAAIPGIAAWRAAYKGFGVKKTSYRSSVERLVKRVLAGEPLPTISTLVDIYNAVSLEHGLCCGADDLDRVTPPLAFRFARPGDSFLDMGAAAGEDPNDPPKAGEVVYADAEKVLCRRWNWRQDSRSAIGTETRRAVITVQANGWGDLEAAVADLEGLIVSHCGGRVAVAVAEAGRGVVAVG